MKLTELALHKHVVELLEIAAAPGVVWYHPANGEKRDKATASKLKRMGVRAGVSDLNFILPAPNGGHRAAFLELKAPGGKLSKSQREFLDSVEAKGCLTAVVSTPDEALKILIAWRAVNSAASGIIFSKGKAAI